MTGHHRPPALAPSSPSVVSLVRPTIVPDPAPIRRRGRPQRLPCDATPFTGASVDATCRMAWLIATSRLLSPATGSMPRTEFLERLGAHGVRADATRISRWESGTSPLSPRLLAAYESVADLPAGVLFAADSMLRRLSPAGTRPGSNAGEVDVDELDELFELVEGGEATGGHWVRLTHELARREHMYLHPSTWSQLGTQLLSELTRTTGPAHLRRYEAAANLMVHARGRAHLTKTLGLFVMHPDAQSVAPALSLLREIRDPGAGELLLRLMGAERTILRRAASGVVGGMLARGLLPDGAEEALEGHARHELHRRALTRRVDALDLSVQLSDLSSERLLGAIAEPTTRKRVAEARETRQLVPLRLSRAIGEGVAVAAEAATGRASFDPDQMLRLLIREALFHTQGERRQLAAALLSASPYARPVARALLGLARDADEVIAGMCWLTLTRLGHVLERREVAHVALEEQRPGLRALGMNALAMACGDLDGSACETLRSTATAAPTGALRHAAVLTLGLAGHPDLDALQRGGDEASARAATWWAALGPMINDRDVPLPSA